MTALMDHTEECRAFMYRITREPTSDRACICGAGTKALPRLEVREYEERPGAFYIAVGDSGRWIIDDPEQARQIVAVYNAARPGG